MQPPPRASKASRVLAGTAVSGAAHSPGGPQVVHPAPRRRIARPPRAPSQRHHVRLLRGGRRSRQRRPETASAPPRRPRGRRGCHRVAVLTGLARRCSNITHASSVLHRLGLMDHPARPGGKAQLGAPAAGAAAPLPPARIKTAVSLWMMPCVSAARCVPTGRCASRRGLTLECTPETTPRRTRRRVDFTSLWSRIGTLQTKVQAVRVGAWPRALGRRRLDGQAVSSSCLGPVERTTRYFLEPFQRRYNAL